MDRILTSYSSLVRYMKQQTDRRTDDYQEQLYQIRYTENQPTMTEIKITYPRLGV